MAISFDSIAQDCVSVHCDSTAPVGYPCKFIGSGSISACSDGNAFHGIAMSQNGNLVALAVHGFVTVPYSGAMPSIGYCPLAAAGSGKVKKLDGAKERLVVSVNSSASTVTFLL